MNSINSSVLPEKVMFIDHYKIKRAPLSPSKWPNSLTIFIISLKQLILSSVLSLDNLGNHGQAITYYDKALAIDPNNFAALTNKGAVLDSLRNYTQAITYLDKALAIDPNSVNANRLC